MLKELESKLSEDKYAVKKLEGRREEVRRGAKDGEVCAGDGDRVAI